MAAGSPNEFSILLGKGRWIQARLDGIHNGIAGWSFKTGGTLTRSDLPEIIAGGLSGLGRFGGHLGRNNAYGLYSVGRHSLLLARFLQEHFRTIASKHTLALALLHDAPECLGLGDINSGLKRVAAPEGSPLRTYDNALVDWLCRMLGVRAADADYSIVHHVDHLFGDVEAYLLDMIKGWDKEGVVKLNLNPTVLDFLSARYLYDISPDHTALEWMKLWREVAGSFKPF